MEKFKKLGIDGPALKEIKKMGFISPTKIQDAAIPLALEGRDVIAKSATGSGKTLIFAATLAQHLKPNKGIQALVLTPTRELTEQVADMVSVLTKPRGLGVTKVIGGMPIDKQISEIKSAAIVVGTPGRILDHSHRRTLDLGHVKILVLDEADRMFDMGFIHDVERIIRLCPKDRQTMLFSATINDAVMRISEKHMRSPISVNGEEVVDPSKLRQAYYDTDRQHKLALLLHMLKKNHDGLSMVFCNSRVGVDFVQKNLAANGINAHALHGGMAQNKRNKVISGFHSNDIRVLVCTDVAARGLDIKGVKHIYNYNIPHDAVDYIHRIGRTARAGEEGMATSLLTEEEYPDFRRILKMGMDIKRLEVPKLKQVKLIGREPQEKPRENWGRRPPRGHKRTPRSPKRHGSYSYGNKIRSR